jgi:23S rRNA pseudouridine2605 synthase
MPIPTSPPVAPARLSKVLSRAGVGSRREVDALIASGQVVVNGEAARLGQLYEPGQTIFVAGQPVLAGEAEPPRLWRFHKPPGMLVTSRDPQGRPVIYDVLPPGLPRVVSVGRLDFNSEGLLLLTTNGGLARHLELPATGLARRYRVRVHGVVNPASLARLKAGMIVDGVRYGPAEATLDRQQGHNAWLTLVLREGKNREVRRLMEALGYPVTRLIRTAYGGFSLGSLPPGGLEEVPALHLRNQLGERIHRQLTAGA